MKIELRGHQGEIVRLRFHGRLLASASTDGTARIWDLETRQAVLLEGHLAEVRDVARVRGAWVTVSDDCGVRRFDDQGRLLSLIKGHTSAVRAIAVSPRASRFATVSADGSVRVFTHRGEPGPVLGGHERGARAAWFLGWTRLATLSEQGKRRVFDTRDGRRVKRRVPKPNAERLPSGVRVKGALDATHHYLGREDGTLAILVEDRTVAVLPGHDDAITAVALSDDGEWLATGAADGAVHVWPWRAALALNPPEARQQVPSLPLVWQRKVEETADLRFEGDSLWVGRADALLELSVVDGAPGRRLKGEGDVVAFGPRTVAFAHYDQRVTLLDRRSQKVVLAVKLEGQYLRPYFSPRGQPLLWVTRRKSREDHVQFLDPEGQRLARSLGPLARVGDRFVLRADGGRLLVPLDGPGALLFEVATERLLGTMRWAGESALEMQFTHDGARVVVGTRSGKALVFDANDASLVCELIPPRRHDYGQGWTPIKVSPGSHRVVAWGDDNRHGVLFDSQRGLAIASLFADEDSGWMVGKFSPDGSRFVASMRHKPRLSIFDAETGRELARHAVLRNECSTANFRFFGAGRRVLAYSSGEVDRSLRAFDLESGRRLWANLGLSGESIGYLAISPDERLLAVTCNDSELVRVVSLEDGATVAELPGHPAYAREPVFSPDGRFLATGSNEGPVQLFRL